MEKAPFTLSAQKKEEAKAKKPLHPLSLALKVWGDIKEELQEKGEEDETSWQDGAPVPPEELKKVAKWFQQTVTKFGASAAVADGPKDPALKDISEQVVKAFTAAAGTLLSIRRGAGPSLRGELRDVGGGLAEATEHLGAAVGTDKMAVCAGKVLDRIKHLERMSVHNRAACRRRLLTCLSQLRDANKELTDTLKQSGGAQSGAGESDLDFDDDDDDLDMEMEPEERRVVEAVVTVICAVEELLKKTSVAAIHKPGESAEKAGLSIVDLEAAAKHAALAAHAVDSLAADSQGGLDVVAFRKSFKELMGATTVLSGFFPAEGSTDLGAAMEEVQVALKECEES